MSEFLKKTDYIGYEYKEMLVDTSRISMYLDGFESFGWKTDEHFEITKGIGKTAIHLKRDRKIANRTELTRLQHNFEACIIDLDRLEAEKTRAPQIIALTTGIIGTAFMAGSVFAVTATPPIIWLCIIFAIPGILGWIAPSLLYKNYVQKKTALISPLIEKKYDDIYALCKKGSSLL